MKRNPRARKAIARIEIVVPVKHTILPRQPDGSSAPTPVVVSIDISEIDEFSSIGEAVP